MLHVSNERHVRIRIANDSWGGATQEKIVQERGNPRIGAEDYIVTYPRIIALFYFPASSLVLSFNFTVVFAIVVFQAVGRMWQGGSMVGRKRNCQGGEGA